MTRRADRSAAMAAALLVMSLALVSCNSQVAPSSVAYSQADLRLGTGATAAAGSAVTVTYTGWFYDPSKSDNKGVIFDTSTGRDPMTFTLGQGSVIEGWEQGLIGMQNGGLRRLVVPPSLAYGPERYATIPPNATLLFEIELLDVQ